MATAINLVKQDSGVERANRPLRAMFVITTLEVGGAETLLVNLLRRMDRARFLPELCCLKSMGALGEQIADEVPVHHDLLRHKYDVAVLGRLTRLLRARQVDAVITVGAGDKMFWGRLAAARARVPVVISALHSTGWPDEITFLNRRLTGLTDAFVAVAGRHARYLAEQEKLPSRRVVVIPNGVDLKTFHPRPKNAAMLARLGIPKGTPVAGIVAVLRPEKNHELFLQMAARVVRQLPEAHFLVIGDGPRRAELEVLASRFGLGGQTHFVGRRADVPELLSLLDVFVLTSQIEANPVSILEAGATGKPVVATAVGSIPEAVLEGQTGFLVEPGDVNLLAKRVLEVFTNPGMAQRLGAAARQQMVQNWSIERTVSGYEELIERLYEKKRARHASPLTRKGDGRNR
ncbi:MAG: glycosyltransferase [Pirellulales bacterium]|nr:glycosyltransferase [Pirellulales bacterium]